MIQVPLPDAWTKRCPAPHPRRKFSNQKAYNTSQTERLGRLQIGNGWKEIFNNLEILEVCRVPRTRRQVELLGLAFR
jgi:hypothetical protein